ncbi:MAG TPA: cell division ATP-binding protein FtsE [Glaciibacter sp.]|nr:cell division ATP-binding protein FtsE [Glaciibacter sp.]
MDLEILRGEFVFLVGASGSGKSSCLRLVLKEEKPTSGSIHVMGQDLRTISNRKVPYFRRNIGVVFQDFRLLPNKSVYENVAFSLQVIGKSRGFIQEAVPDTLQMVGLAEKAQRLPHELSGGEQQRVAIARAIVNKPQILLADEPTGNLDPTTSAGIMALLDRINAGGTTVMMATHEAGIVDQMQRRVIELSAGQIVRDEKRGGYATSAIPIVTTDSRATATVSGATASHSTVSTMTAPHPIVENATLESEAGASDAPTPALFKTPAPPMREAAADTRPASIPAATPAAAPQRFAPPAAHVEEAEATPSTHTSVDEVSTGSTTGTGSATDEVSTGSTTGAGSTPEADSATGTDAPTETERPMTRPVLPVTQHDIPEQLTLAEKLGLRAPGEKPNPTGEQNVGPTR